MRHIRAFFENSRKNVYSSTENNRGKGNALAEGPVRRN